MKHILAVLAPLAVAMLDRAQEPKTLVGVKYGRHPAQFVDFFQAKSDKPTPVVIYIHGGGWRSSGREIKPQPFLDNGISVVSIHYRFVQHAEEAKIEPPVKAPLEDAARALQFIRSKAGEWNLDKKRIGATGGSAGGCSSLWLALHDDLADPKSPDPVARESTRLYCAAVDAAQVSLDPKELREWMPNYGYGAHAFGLPNVQSVIDNRENLLKWIKEYSPIEHVSKDDPPIGLFYGGSKPIKGESPKDPPHSNINGLMLEERLKAVGVDVCFDSGQRKPKYKSSTEYLIDRLLK